MKIPEAEHRLAYILRHTPVFQGEAEPVKGRPVKMPVIHVFQDPFRQLQRDLPLRPARVGRFFPFSEDGAGGGPVQDAFLPSFPEKLPGKRQARRGRFRPGSGANSDGRPGLLCETGSGGRSGLLSDARSGGRSGLLCVGAVQPHAHAQDGRAAFHPAALRSSSGRRRLQQDGPGGYRRAVQKMRARDQKRHAPDQAAVVRPVEASLKGKQLIGKSVAHPDRQPVFLPGS